MAFKDSDQESSDESIYDKEEEQTISIKKQLVQIFDSVDDHAVGSFALAKEAKDAPNPGLFVEDVGAIGMPLSDRDAALLAKACHQAPFGKGSATIVDTSVRKSWELNASQFCLRNPAWDSWVAGLAADISKGLGVPEERETMKIEPYKLLLYEKGAFFDKHRDSEKAEGMFATLVIALPSEHKGGEVEASFGGQTKELDTSSLSAFGYQWLAWYADVEHAVKPVTEGYRLVLTYNIVHTANNAIPSATTLNDEKLRLGLVLDFWKSEDEYSPPWLAYRLGHKYTDANLRLAHLKGNDRAKANLLKEVCETKGFAFFLANVERSVEGGVDEDEDGYGYHGPSYAYSDGFHELCEIYEDGLKLATLVDEQGTIFGKDMPLEEVHLVQRKAFIKGKPDDEDYSGPTGNEGVTATHFYRNSCLVVLPMDKYVDFLVPAAINKSLDLKQWVEILIGQYLRNPDSENKQNLTAFCDCIFFEAERKPPDPGTDAYYMLSSSAAKRLEQDQKFADEGYPFVIQIACHLQDIEMVEKAANLLKKEPHKDVFYSVGSLARHFAFDDCMSLLNLVYSRVKSIHARWNAIQAVMDGFQGGPTNHQLNSDALKGWRQAQLESLLESIIVSKEDADVLVLLACAAGEQFVFKKILPLLKDHISNLQLIPQVLIRFAQADERKELRHEIILSLFKDIMANWCAGLSLTNAVRVTKKVRQDNFGYWRSREDKYEDVVQADISASVLANVVGSCYSVGAPESAHELLETISQQAGKADNTVHIELILPFLGALLNVLRKFELSLAEDLYKRWFNTIVGASIQRYLGPDPRLIKVEDQRRKPIPNPCCGDCHEMNEFLQHPRQTQNSWPMTIARRIHLEKKSKGRAVRIGVKQQKRPHIVDLKKIDENINDEVRQWESKRIKIECKLGQLGKESLQTIFGADTPTAVVDQCLEALAAEFQSRAPLGEMSQAPQTAGQSGATKQGENRSGPEIVDLT